MSRFITFEGGEGAGKSTQLRLLSQSLKAAGIAHITTREPGGCDCAEQIRDLLVRGSADRWLPETEALLMMAARSEHVQRTILPALADGTWVLCDRFFDSTLIYQGLARGLGQGWIQQLYHLLFGHFQPDLTLYFDIDPEQGLARTQTRGDDEQRFESLPLSFHQQVRNGFTALAKAQPQRIAVIDAAADCARVHQQVLEAMQQHDGCMLEPAHG